MRFLHTADWQLGMTRHFLDGDAQPRYTAARLDVVRRIGQVAREQDCAFVLVCGDVLESPAVPARVVGRAVEALGEIGLPVHLLPGNHDPHDAASVWSSPALAAAPPSVHVLTTPGPHRVAEGVEILAAPWLSKRPAHDLVAEALAGARADGVLRVLAAHGAVDVLVPGSGDPGAPTVMALADLERAVTSGVVQYVALGDRHSRTRVGSTGAVWYSGTPEVTDVAEDDPGHVLVVDLEAGRSPLVTAHHVGTWAFTALRADVGSEQDVRALDARLTALPRRDRTAVRLSLVGTLSVAEKALLDGVLARHTDVLASLQVWEPTSDLVVRLGEVSVDQMGLSGFAAGAVEELATTAAGGGPQARAAQDALSLVYRLTGAGSTR